MKGMKLTAGLLVAATLITTLPVEALASQSAGSKYMAGTSVSFSAGATASINDTVVLNDTNTASLTANDAPVVAAAVDAYANMAVAANIDEFLNIRAEANTDSSGQGI